MKTETLRQRCAHYIIGNPGCTSLEILVGTQAYAKGTKVICKTLKSMVDAGELTREGALKSYTYSAGANIMDAIDGVKAPPKKPISGRKGIPNHKGSILTIKQVWVRAGEYVIAIGDTRHNSLWNYADSFVTDATQVVEIQG